MSKVTESANGQPCMVRLPGICNRDRQTVVFAHITAGAGISGWAIKPVDACGVYACSCCHDVIDGRAASAWSQEQVDSFVLAGMARTLTALVKQGLLETR